MPMPLVRFKKMKKKIAKEFKKSKKNMQKGLAAISGYIKKEERTSFKAISNERMAIKTVPPLHISGSATPGISAVLRVLKSAPRSEL